MNTPLVSGSKYLLDEKIVVIIIKSATRSGSMYAIEIPGRSVESVERERLTPFVDLDPSNESTKV